MRAGAAHTRASTKANAYCERLVGSIRSECLDFMIPLGEILWFPKTPFSGFQPDVTLLHSHREVSTTRLRIAESAQGRKP